MKNWGFWSQKTRWGHLEKKGNYLPKFAKELARRGGEKRSENRAAISEKDQADKTGNDKGG